MLAKTLSLVWFHYLVRLYFSVPSFAYEPLDLESNPFNENSSRAAFSCAVLGIKPVTNIQWYFEMMQFGSGMGPELMDGILTNNMDSVTISNGNDVISTRASVLLLDNVGSQHEGFYRCVVTFADEQTLSSRNASLRFNGNLSISVNRDCVPILYNDTIVLLFL